MPEVRYDNRSLIVNETRIWLTSGSVHYFRTPSGLWADRLLKAKRAGLNCISTYVAWNFHEPEEGKWQLSGDHDLVQFIQLAGELGLYVILRPGPYICAEWDFGGLPGWLSSKSGIAYRTSNAAYMHYFDKYFANILPRLAELQVTRDGNIILIQNENEYMMTTMPERENYLRFISQLFRRAGFDIPIINCNLFSDPPVEDSIECVNGWDRCIQLLKRLRLRQPAAPLFVTEFWTGWFDYWGGEHHRRDDLEVARRAMEILGAGAQLNYYMWHGGTNFAFWGSQLNATDTSYQTTSYDYDAPLAEGGGLTDKYYLTRPINTLATQMGRFFASCTAEAPGVRIHDNTDVLNLAGPLGRWAIVTNNGRAEIETATISLPAGQELTVPLKPLGAVAIPMELQLGPKLKLDYANCTPLGLFGENTLVLHGPEGWEAKISINGELLCHEVPDGDEPLVIEHEMLRIVLINSDLATRTWWVDGQLIFGPDYVGETPEQIVEHPRTKQNFTLSADGQLKHKKTSAAQPPKPTSPRVGVWKRVAVCQELGKKDTLDWKKIDRPRNADALGAHHGYMWYRIQITETRLKTRYLFAPHCRDRATIFLNGMRIGVWGTGQDATTSPIRATMKKGKNTLTLLVDNLGRINFGARLGQEKGLFGHLFDARPIKPNKFKLKAADSFSKRIVPRSSVHLLGKLEALPVWEATAEFTLSKVVPIHLSFTDLPHHVAVLCNERMAGFFQASSADGKTNNYGDVTLGAGLKKGRNTIKLLLWGDATKQDLGKVTFHALKESISQQATWSFRPWEVPELSAVRTARRRHPAWYASKFKWRQTTVPLFLQIAGAKKGQILLNGHNVGRFWTIGPQQYYYLPECWLEQTNQLLIFEENGLAPRNCRLVFRPRGPYRD